MKRSLRSLPLLLALAACSTAAHGRGPSPRPAQSALRKSAPAPETIPRALLQHVNEARSKEGQPPLLPDDALQRAAQRYAEELARRGVVDHDSPTPGRRTFITRLAAEGVKRRGAGENLAAVSDAPAAVASRVVALWLRSGYHRANLLEPAFTRTGIGVAAGRDGAWYVAEEYATAR